MPADPIDDLVAVAVDRLQSELLGFEIAIRAVERREVDEIRQAIRALASSRSVACIRALDHLCVELRRKAGKAP